ncbi:MAG: hypothetical protein ACRDHP_18580 [Ktedonobacterales bacterium]
MNTLPPPPSGNEWELDVEDAFGAHDTEYWVWSGNRLVPATPDQVTIIREREALLRLSAWTAREAAHVDTAALPLPGMRWVAWLRHIAARLAPSAAKSVESGEPAPASAPHVSSSASGDSAASKQLAP